MKPNRVCRKCSKAKPADQFASGSTLCKECKQKLYYRPASNADPRTSKRWLQTEEMVKRGLIKVRLPGASSE